MKKFLISFIFLLISMLFVFLPEVYSINYTSYFDTEMNALNGLDGESVRVTVGVHDNADSSGNQIYNINETIHRKNGNNGNGNNKYYLDRSATELKVASPTEGGIPLVIFVGTRDADINNDDIVECNITGDVRLKNEYNKDATTDGDNKAGAYYMVYPKNNGINHIYITFQVAHPKKDAHISFNVEIVVNVNPNAESSGDGVEDNTQGKDDSTEEGDEDSINANNVNVIISQGEINYWSREYTNMNGNGKEADAPVIDITLYNSFAQSRDIKIYIASEEVGLSGESYIDVTQNGNEIKKQDGSEAHIDYTGCNCFISNTYIRLNKGKHNIKFHIYNPDESEGLNFYVNITFFVADFASGPEKLLEKYKDKIDGINQDDVLVVINQTSHNSGVEHEEAHTFKNANSAGNNIGVIKIEDFIFSNTENMEILIATEESGASGQYEIKIQEGDKTITPSENPITYIQGVGFGFDINALVHYTKLKNLRNRMAYFNILCERRRN